MLLLAGRHCARAAPLVHFLACTPAAAHYLGRQALDPLPTHHIAALPCPITISASLCRWDPLTKEIFQLVRSKGVATFTQIDAHVKATAAKHVAGALVWRGRRAAACCLNGRFVLMNCMDCACMRGHSNNCTWWLLLAAPPGPARPCAVRPAPRRLPRPPCRSHGHPAGPVAQSVLSAQAAQHLPPAGALAWLGLP